MIFLDLDRVNIRQARREDCRTIASLYRISSDGVADYIWLKLADGNEDLLDVGERRYQREGYMFSYENCLVAEFDGKITGMMVSFPMLVDTGYVEEDPVLAPYSILEEDRSFYICGIAIFPEFRGQGLGQQFMRLAEDKARELSLNKLSLIVFEQNKVAQGLYHKLGYQEVARQKIVEHPLIKATGDAILMVKRL